MTSQVNPASKAELLSQTIEHIDIKKHNVVPLVEAMQHMAYSARDLYRAADIYDRMLRDRECGVILCLAGSLETEFNSLPASLREQTEALTRELLAWLAATLQEGRESGVFQFSGDPAHKAALILSSLQGALQMARALGTEQFQAVLVQHKQDLMMAM